MIFVTVGTHEQQFDRLVKYIDELKIRGILEEDVVIQTGYSSYEPKCCTWSKFYTFQEMLDYVKDARIIITHGGPSSFFMALQEGKIPIVVPRQKKYNEHVNDHQLEFAQEVSRRMGIIITINNIEELKDVIINYDKILLNNKDFINSNNKSFNDELEKIVDEMFIKK